MRLCNHSDFISKRVAWLCVSGGLIVAPALAQSVPDPAFSWSSVGGVGNRGLNQAEAPFLWERPNTGTVNYNYQMTTTEVTNAQYIEFVRAYKPFQEGSLNDVNYTGRWIGYQSSIDDFTVSDSLLHAPATTSWHYAARMLNWMHNGKVNEKWAFETGVYDTSTFGRDPETNDLTDQPVHSPGAKYWLPTLDEWTKAMYWDPDKDGEGGYWQYENGSDTQPISGLPGIGETNAGTNALLAVGSYPDVTSPWGFLDGSGGDTEWLETLSFGDAARMQKGSAFFTSLTFLDTYTVNRVDNGFPQFASGAFRIATQVPSPASFICYGAIGVIGARRRRR